MPIVFAAIVPHSPLLLPTIGKEHKGKVHKTVQSYRLLEEELYASKPDSLILLARHGKIFSDAFNINFNSQYISHFEEFGDFTTRSHFRSDSITIQHLRTCSADTKDFPIILTTEPILDYAASIPLLLLTSHLPQLPIVPINESGGDLLKHYSFGSFLKRRLLHINKRYAVIASGELSHRLTPKAPGGYSEQGKVFDEKLISLIQKRDFQGILSIDSQLSQEAAESCLKIFTILFGILHEMNFTVNILSYEHPFGVGYLTVHFPIR